jgi:hypothetical protein
MIYCYQCNQRENFDLWFVPMLTGKFPDNLLPLGDCPNKEYHNENGAIFFGGLNETRLA